MNDNRDKFRQAVRETAWDIGRECPHCGGDGKLPGGRRVIKCWMGGFGADWDEQDVLDLIDHADSVEWRRGLLGADLAVVKDDKAYRFDVREPWRPS